MKKKIFSTLLMGAFFLASMSMFTSCKDYDDDINDLRNKIEANATTLTQLVDQKINNVTTELNSLKSAQTDLAKAYADADANLKTALEKSIKEGDDAAKTYAETQANAAQVAAIAAAKASIDSAVETLTKSLDAAKADIAENGKSIASLIKADADLQSAIDNANADVKKAQETADAAKTLAEKNAVELANTNKTIADNQEKLAQDLTAINNRIDVVKQAMDNELTLLNGRVDEVSELASTNQANITALDARVKSLEETNEEVQETLKSLAETDAKLLELIQANADEIKTLKEVTIADIYEKIGTNAGKIQANSDAIQAIIDDLTENYWTAEKIKEYIAAEKADLNESLLKAIKEQSKKDSIYAKGLVDALAEQVTLDIAAGVDEAKQYTDDEIVKALATAYEKAEELVNTKIADLQTAYKAADKTLQDSIDVVAANLTTAEQALSGRIKNLEDANLATRLSALEELLKGLGDDAEEGEDPLEKFSENIKNLGELAGSLNEAVEEIQGLYQTMITSVNLFTTVEDHNDGGKYGNHQLTFTAVDEKNASFGKDFTNGEFTFTEGKHVTYGDKVIIRVSPSTANLKPAMISLINSKGVASKLVTVKSVEPFDELITRASNNNGLWTVEFQLSDEYTPEDLEAEFFAGEDESIVYAVAVNNINQDAAEADQRRVVSEYDLTLLAAPGEPASPDFYVYSNLIPEKWRSVNEIHNRYSATELEGISTADVKELEWNDNNEPAVAATDDNASDRATNYDDRQDKKILPVEIGKDIKIAINAELNNNGVPEIVAPIKGFYVTLDKEFALESGGSEVNAWAKYTYENVAVINRNGVVTQKGKLFEGNEGTIKITDLDGVTLGDIIGFRVYAVNLDGTLLDPDGRAFYVRVGEAGVDDVVNVDLLANAKGFSNVTNVADLIASDINVGVADLNATFKSFTGKTNGKLVITEASKENMVNKNHNIFYVLLDGDGNEVSDWKDAKKVKVGINVAKNWLDNATFTGTVECIDETTGTLINKLTVNVKKVLPTAAPDDVKFKSGQVVNGVYTCYVDPQYAVDPDWSTASDKGYKDLVHATNGLDDYSNYEWTIQNGDDPISVKATQTSLLGFDNDYIVEADKSLVDGTTKHSSTLAYLYEGISTTDVENASKQGQDWPVAIKDLDGKVDIIFACIIDQISYAWDGAQPTLTYAETSLKQGTAAIGLNKIKGTSPRDSKYNGAFNKDYYVGDFSAKLTTDANGLEEYYDVEFDGSNLTFNLKSNTSNPAVNVPSHLKLTATDAFGHTREIANLAVTIVKR